MELINALPKQINLGNQGESGITTIDVDCTAWLTDFPAGALVVTFLPPETYQTKLLPNTQAYMLPDGTTLRIIVNRNMTQYAGKGSLNIRLVEGDSIEKRSAVAGTYVAPSHPTAAEEMPADVEDWATEATQKLAEIMARMGFIPKGPYNPANENKHGEWYTHEGGSWGYIWPEPSTGVPLTDTTHWQQIASQGNTGLSAYDAAVVGGYTGTEAEFNAANAGIEEAKENAETATQEANEAAQSANEAAESIPAEVTDQINTRLGGLSFSVDPVDAGLNITYTY